MTHVQPGRAAAAEMPMGQRAAQAGVGLCTSCRHPVRLHGDVGCVKGECECTATGRDLRAGVTTTAAPTSPPSTAELAFLDVRCACGHVRTEHRVAGSSVLCRRCTCHGFAAATATPEETTDAPVAPQADPTPPTPDWSPAVALAAAAAGVMAEARRGPAASKPAARLAAPARPRHPARPAASTAQGYAAVVGEHDAVEEVTAGSGATGPAVTDPPLTPGEVRFGPLPATVHVTPAPLDLTPFLGAALYYYPAWYCKGCLQRRHNPGVHCRRPLQPVYVVIAPRSVS